jgi:hypothetical protein
MKKRIMEVMVGLLLAGASVQAETGVRKPLADVRLLIAAAFTEAGAVLVNNSEDHPAFELELEEHEWDGRKIYNVYRYKLVPSRDGKSTMISATWEVWRDRSKGSYPDTIQVDAMTKEEAARAAKTAEETVAQMINEYDGRQHQSKTMVGI